MPNKLDTDTQRTEILDISYDPSKELTASEIAQREQNEREQERKRMAQGVNQHLRNILNA